MIYELLAEGRENARTGRQLADICGCDIRAITAQIERERREAGRYARQLETVRATIYPRTTRS